MRQSTIDTSRALPPRTSTSIWPHSGSLGQSRHLATASTKHCSRARTGARFLNQLLRGAGASCQRSSLEVFQDLIVSSKAFCTKSVGLVQATSSGKSSSRRMPLASLTAQEVSFQCQKRASRIRYPEALY